MNSKHRKLLSQIAVTRTVHSELARFVPKLPEGSQHACDSCHGTGEETLIRSVRIGSSPVFRQKIGGKRGAFAITANKSWNAAITSLEYIPGPRSRLPLRS